MCLPAPIGQDEFAQLMAGLGPWPADRRVAVAVSGGADSLCLAWLVRHWGAARALIVDHGLRPGSAGEAREAAARLAAFGVPAQVLTLEGLAHGPGLAARARSARYAALTEAARNNGLSDLLLGHHARDQAETLLIRREGGSGAAGLAGMAVLAETNDLRLIRPLLGVPPGRLRATLRATGISWAEDPSNRNPAATRTRMRTLIDDPDGAGPATTALRRETEAYGVGRRAAEARIAATLAARSSIFPEGYARLTPGPIESDALAALIRMLGGSPYTPPHASVSRLAGDLRGTLGGVRLMPAGGPHAGTLLVREPAAMQPPIPARHGRVWDGRFRLEAPAGLPANLTIGALGSDASRLRKRSLLPAAVLVTLPALRDTHGLVAVPHLGYFKEWTNTTVRLRLCPKVPASGAGFLAFAPGDGSGGCGTDPGTPCP